MADKKIWIVSCDSVDNYCNVYSERQTEIRPYEDQEFMLVDADCVESMYHLFTLLFEGNYQGTMRELRKILLEPV